MDKCPKCGHWMLSYSQAKQMWECYCQTVIYINNGNVGCHCNHTISESYESWGKRLREQNHKGRYSVDPPTVANESTKKTTP
jgi:hypothetical protein